MITTALNWKRGGIGTCLAAAVVLPWLLNGYTISLVSNALILAALAASTYVLTIAGMPSFGQTAYLGVGAYVAAILSRENITIGLIHIVVAAISGALAAAIIGPVVLRARGEVFLMVTFALGQLAVVAASKTAALGYDEGLSISAITLPGGTPLTNDGYLYLYCLAVFIPLLASTAWLSRSRLGTRLRAIADHEPRMAALGHRTSRDLLLGYMAAGAIAAVGGCLLTATHRFVSPADFGFDTAALALLACVIGSGSLAGAVFGAILIIVTRDLIGATTSGHGVALLGVLFLVIAYGRPHLRTIVTFIQTAIARRGN